MKYQETYNDFKKIIVDEIPLIDVRAPIEYEKGSFKGAVNLPIMNDEERHLIGIRYKEEGNEQAVLLGEALVSGLIKEARIKSWKDFIDKNPNCFIYCFRGGQRSRITQEWIYEETGYKIPRLEGGYKALRNHLINALEPGNINTKPVILGGHTGSGKTILLKKFENFLDLEGIANHRGSSFGNNISPQPSQIDFENNLAYDIVKKLNKGYDHILVEDEGRHVGRRYLPRELSDFFTDSPLVILEVPVERRIEITLDEYVINEQRYYIEAYSETEGMAMWEGFIKGSIDKAKKRLGLERYLRICQALEEAIALQGNTGDVDGHRKWIEILLREYYDPMYGYQIDKNEKRIIFKGNEAEVFEYLKTIDVNNMK